MNIAPSWTCMHAQLGRSIATLEKAEIPEKPGVYAHYRDGVRMYVGKADCLQNRIWKTTADDGP
jgi:excinuclease UvrABC nuclease subunit